MNILHSVNEKDITPELFLAAIEIPAGSNCKYELDEHSGALKLDRILYTATHYPQNYGFIPKTWGLDGDPLDVLVITSCPVVPMALVRAYPIGILSMTDSGKIDEKIIAICADDPFYNEYKDIKDLPKHILLEIHHFFTVYKQLEHGKETVIEGIHGVEKAKDVIARAKKRYHEQFPDR